MKPLAVKALPATPVAVEPERIAVNLKELNARIHGYHADLDEVKGALIDAQKQLDQHAATRMVARLERLEQQRQFVALYYDSLTDDERRTVAAPRPLAATAQLAASRLQQMESAPGEDFLEPFAADFTAELHSRLEKLLATPGASR